MMSVRLENKEDRVSACVRRANEKALFGLIPFDRLLFLAMIHPHRWLAPRKLPSLALVSLDSLASCIRPLFFSLSLSVSRTCANSIS